MGRVALPLRQAGLMRLRRVRNNDDVPPLGVGRAAILAHDMARVHGQDEQARRIGGRRHGAGAVLSKRAGKANRPGTRSPTWQAVKSYLRGSRNQSLSFIGYRAKRSFRKHTPTQHPNGDNQCQ